MWSTIIKNADETDDKVIVSSTSENKRGSGFILQLKNPALVLYIVLEVPKMFWWFGQGFAKSFWHWKLIMNFEITIISQHFSSKNNLPRKNNHYGYF